MQQWTAITQWIWQWVIPFAMLWTAAVCFVSLRGQPLRGFGALLRDTYGRLFQTQKNAQGPTQRQIFATALAATMGVGNLVGTAAALSIGGAGAIFWMWVSAWIGMILVYAENILGMRYRTQATDGRWIGGAIAYLRDGVGSSVLAGLFAFFCAISALGMGNLAQTNALANAGLQLGIPLPLTGVLTACGLLAVLSGGARRMGRAMEWLMPLVCGCYLLGCLWLLIQNVERLPAALLQIVQGAFGWRAVGGGVCGTAWVAAVSTGFRRGIFSNEAGLGSSALLHMETSVNQPLQQGKWAVAEVFADTIVCCTATALVILTAPISRLSGMEGTALLLQAFSSGLGEWSGIFLAICIVLLAFATVVGWYACGSTAFRYLFGAQNVCWYFALYIVVAFAGALCQPAWIWVICDFCNAGMAVPNLMGLCMLRSQLRLATKQRNNV